MNTAGPNDPPEPLTARGPKLSGFAGPVEELIRSGVVQAPTAAGGLGRVDRFELLRYLGCGGMGVVFLVRDTCQGKNVALKLLRADLAVQPRARQLFLRELRLMRQLSHPHILPILDFRESAGQVWFTMPYMEAGSAENLLAAGSPLDTPTAQRLIRQVADALRHVHHQGIIHRDLKPANILLDSQTNALLTDFGLACDLSGDSILGGGDQPFIGTAAYMSPAAVARQSEDTRGDIYSLGAVLFGFLTGQAPYRGSTTGEIMEKVRNGPPPPIRKLNPAAEPRLAEIAQSAMARALRDRYACMDDLIADLDRVASGVTPLGAHGQWKAPAHWCRATLHNPARVAAGVGLLLLCGALWYGDRLTLSPIAAFDPPMPFDSIKLGEADADGRPEFFGMLSNQCHVFSREGRLIKQIAYAGHVPPDSGIGPGTKFELCGVTDVNGDGCSDIVVRWWQDGPPATNDRRAGWAHAAAFNVRGYLLGHYSVPGSSKFRDQEWHSTALVPDLLTNLVASDGRDLVVRVMSGYALRPRGLVCFAATNKSSRSRWSNVVELAASPHAPVAADVDRDGRLDALLLGTHAPDNGNVLEDGTDDSHACLYAFSNQGRVLWKTNLGDKYSSVLPVVLRSAGATVVCALVCRRHGYVEDEDIPTSPPLPEIGSIIAFDPSGRKLRQIELGLHILSYVAEDLDGNGDDELLVTDRTGRLMILNAGLEVVRSVQVVQPPGLHETNQWCEPMIAGTLSTKGRREKLIALRCARVEAKYNLRYLGNQVEKEARQTVSGVTLQVWSADLRLLASRSLADAPSDIPIEVVLADWDRDGVEELVAIGGQIRVYKFGRRGLRWVH
jgi:hypothetical protein